MYQSLPKNKKKSKQTTKYKQTKQLELLKQIVIKKYYRNHGRFFLLHPIIMGF